MKFPPTQQLVRCSLFVVRCLLFVVVIALATAGEKRDPCLE